MQGICFTVYRRSRHDLQTQRKCNCLTRVPRIRPVHNYTIPNGSSLGAHSAPVCKAAQYGKWQKPPNHQAEQPGCLPCHSISSVACSCSRFPAQSSRCRCRQLHSEPARQTTMSAHRTKSYRHSLHVLHILILQLQLNHLLPQVARKRPELCCHQNIMLCVVWNI